MKRTSRKAFILPLAIMLAFIATMLIASVLSRQSAQSLSAGRQLGQYSAHHLERGLEDTVGAWVRNGSRKSLRERLAPDGLAFTVQLPHGLSSNSSNPEQMMVYFQDAQDTVLADLSALHGQDADDANKVLDALHALVGNQMERYTRMLGPVAVSAQSADRAVLKAVLSAVGASGSDFAIESIMKARNEATPGGGGSGSSLVQEAAKAANLDTEQTAALSRLLSSDTSFWKLKVDIVRNGKLVDGYDGYASINTKGQRDRSGQQAGRGNILQLLRRALD